MNHPISSDVKFATITDSTSDASKVVETATNVIGVLGGIGSNNSRRYEFAANPSAYKSGSVSVLKKANNLFVNQMKELK